MNIAIEVGKDFQDLIAKFSMSLLKHLSAL